MLTNECRDADTEGSFGIDIRRSAPLLLEYSMGNFYELFMKGDCKSIIIGSDSILSLDNWCFILEASPLCMRSFKLGTLFPSLLPVSVSRRSWSCTDGFQHPFSGIGIGREGGAPWRWKYEVRISEYLLISLKYTVLPPLARKSSRSKRWKSIADG